MSEQRRIDISNLRFYAEQAEKMSWQTEGGVIRRDVIAQTLREIANRLEAQLAAVTPAEHQKDAK